VLIAAGVALSAWQAGLTRDSTQAHLSVALLVAAAFVMTFVLGRGHQRVTSGTFLRSGARALGTWRTQPSPGVISVVVWTVLISATVGWDLVSFIYQEHSLPTLSYFVGHVTRYATGRGFLFALWLAVGAYLVAGWRSLSGRQCP
jgi:hypothetical protein